MTEQFANKAATTLSVLANAGDTTISISSATGFPASASYRIIVDNEIMLVTAGAGTTTWTVTRGAEGTTAASHANAAAVTHVLTAASIVQAITDRIAAPLSITGAAGSVTALLVNPSTETGKLIDAQLNSGGSLFSVSNTGAVIAGSFGMGVNPFTAGMSSIYSTSVLQLFPNPNNGGGIFSLTDTTYPAGANTAQFTMTPSNWAQGSQENQIFRVNAATATVTGAMATQRFNLISQPTITSVAAQTVSDAATLVIAGAPIAAGSVTLTRSMALWTQAGGVRFSGLPAFVAADKYVVADSLGNLHISAIGPAS